MDNHLKSNEEIINEMELYGAVDIVRPEIKFEKAYVTMVCNPLYSNNEVRLYLYLRLNDSFTNYGAFPSNKKIANETGMSVPTVTKTLNSLQEKNAILVIQRFYKKDRKQIQNLVMFNKFNQYTGLFEDNEVWQFLKEKYKTRMVWIETRKENDKTLYIPTPIQESELKVRTGRNGEINGYTIL